MPKHTTTFFLASVSASNLFCQHMKETVGIISTSPNLKVSNDPLQGVNVTVICDSVKVMKFADGFRQGLNKAFNAWGWQSTSSAKIAFTERERLGSI